MGGIVSFVGTVRDFTDYQDDDGHSCRIEVTQLEYECYRDMALREMAAIRERALASFDIGEMHMIHRTGDMRPGDQIVMIAVSAAHRKEAFRACEYAIDELKKSVPIWKKESTVTGEYWVGSERRV